MPFTPTHVAAALPLMWLSKWRLPFSALAIGCMIPDLGVFFPRVFNYLAMHSARGLLTDSLPYGLTAYYLFHFVLKQPLVELFPKAIRLRLRSVADKPVSLSIPAIALVAACVVVGAATHVFWDSFTHRFRWGTHVFPALGETAIVISGRNVAWTAVLQHLSSLVILPPLAVYAIRVVWHLPVPEKVDSKTRVADRWILGLAILIVALSVVHLVGGLINYPGYGMAFSLRRTAQLLGGLLMTGAVIYSLAMHFVWWRQGFAGLTEEPTQR